MIIGFYDCYDDFNNYFYNDIYKFKIFIALRQLWYEERNINLGNGEKRPYKNQ